MKEGIVAFLREGTWLTAERVVAYSRMALLTYAGCVTYLVIASHDGVTPWGKPIGSDFLCFWASGALALKGAASSAYDLTTQIAAQATVIPGVPLSYFPWVYPPVFLLPMAVLALLPYGFALVTWIAATGLAYVACLRRIVPHPQTLLVAVAWPGVFDNALSGQNGFLSAALFGAGLTLLERRPVMAGLVLAALCYKPQLAVLVPFALAAGQHWRTLGAMMAGVVILGLVTTLAFGPDVWPAFIESRKLTQELLEGMHGTFTGKVGVFSVVRLLGGTALLAWVVQGAVSGAVAGLVLWTWSRRIPLQSRYALLVAATPLASPWVNIYDLVILAIPAAWLIRDGMGDRFLPWERSVIVAVAVLPVATLGIASAYGIQIAPLVELALVAVVIQRLRSSHSGTRASPCSA